MKQTSSIKVRATSNKYLDDAPKLTTERLQRARFRVAGKDVSKANWQTAVRARVAKQRISIMLDSPVIEHFKAVAGDRGYQTLINDTLRRTVEGEHFVAEMRAAIREELASDKRR
jgi:uncharacterized protein (DUF4415 family)